MLVSVQQRDAATLLPLIQQWILPGTRIISDMWAAYGGIQQLQQQYNHDWINHQIHFADPNDRTIHTNGIGKLESINLELVIAIFRGLLDASEEGPEGAPAAD